MRSWEREDEGGRTHRGVFGGGDMRRKKKQTNKGKEEGGKQIHRGYCFDRCGYVVAVVREREKERQRERTRGCVTWLLVWYIIK